jgi:hypothetical protein
MKKAVLQLLILVGLLLFPSCEDYLDKTPEAKGLVEKDVFTDYLKFRQFEDGMYANLHDYLDGLTQSFSPAMGDEAVGLWGTMRVIRSGDWVSALNSTGGATGAHEFTQTWGSWSSIRIANTSISKLPILEKEGNATVQQLNELKGQAHFMRAWYYFEFLRRWGGMPYIVKPFGPSDNLSVTRLSYYETAKKIAADCDTAANFLPQNWDPANLGRPTKGSAMGLKATALLFAASPFNNPENSTSKWEEAAKASLDLIKYAENTGIYKLWPCKGTATTTYLTPEGIQTIQYTGGYDSIFMYQAYHNEIIWSSQRTINNAPTGPFGVPSLTGNVLVIGVSPTQNIVDKFETINGLAISDDQTFDSQNPYVNRDPRFYHCILFNRQKWTSKPDIYLELFEGGRDRLNEAYYCSTGYLTKKYWAPNVDQWSPVRSPFTQTIYLRYADILLQYAEAVNELGGPNHSIPGSNLTALDAVNLVRQRVNMPNVAQVYLNSKDTFRDRIRNERAIELFAEQKRFYDLMRWGVIDKSENTTIYAAGFTADDTKPTGYAIRKYVSPYGLNYERKHNRFPLPLKDVQMYPDFIQNPGW